jgi:hypothetical protein
MKPRQRSAESGRRHICFACGVWPTAILLETGEQRIADCDGPLFIVFGLEAGLWLETDRDRLVSPIDVHPLGDRCFADAEAGPEEKADECCLNAL